MTVTIASAPRPALSFPQQPRPDGTRPVCCGNLWVGGIEYVRKTGCLKPEDSGWTWQAALFRQPGRLREDGTAERAPLGVALTLRDDDQPALVARVRQRFQKHGQWWTS